MEEGLAMLMLESKTETDAFKLASDDNFDAARRRIAELQAIARAIARGERPRDRRVIEELEIIDALMKT
jgi:hypothetical protein